MLKLTVEKLIDNLLADRHMCPKHMYDIYLRSMWYLNIW